MEIDLLIGEEFGQQEKLTRRINRLLEEYTDGFAVPKELIQNADDAGATEVKFLYDERTNTDAMTGLIDEGMKECQGPALWVFNDAEFHDKDFENIIKLNGATKQQDTSKIGKFGLGFNAVYNLTDVPSFVSRNYIVFFDPHTVYLGKAITDRRKPGIKIDTNKNLRRLRAYRNQFKPYNGIFGCNLLLDKEDNSFQGTLFRFPLRTREQALRSEIKDLYYDSQEMQELLQLFVGGAKSLLLFTQNIRRISIFHLPKSTQANPKAQLMFEVTKSLAKVMRELTVSVTLPATARKLSKDDQKLLQQCNVLQASSEVARSTRDSKMIPTNLLTSSLIVNIDCNITSCGRSFFQCDTVCEAGVEQWFVVSSMGKGQAMQLSREEPNLLPSAGVAVQLKETTRGSFSPQPISNGSLFCYLPLPIISGLPVHVNGAFAVDASRRHLQEKIGDDKTCLGVKWNTTLLKDPSCSAYLCLTEDLKLLCQTGSLSNYSYHLLWPKASSVQTNCKPLLSAFYNHLVSDGLPLFSDGKRWADIRQIVFLHPDLRSNAQIGDVSLQVFRLLMKGKAVVVDLPSNVFQSFQECGLSEVVRSRCYSKFKFFQEVFFPNISSVPSHLRDDLVLHVLDAWSTEFDQLLKTVPCIPATPRGEILQLPGHLIHPEKEAASLFLREEGRFPLDRDGRFQNPFRLAKLEQLGMCTDDMPWEELAERAESIQHLYAMDSEAGINRVEALISFLDRKMKVKRSPLPTTQALRTKGRRLTQANMPSDATQKRLSEAKFLPVLARPNSFPLPWKGDEFQLLIAPEDVFSETLKYLVCCTEPLVGVAISEDIKRILKIKDEGLTLHHITSQLDAALSCDIETLDQTGYQEVKQVCISVFFQLQGALDNHGVSIQQYFYKKEFVLVGTRFLSANLVAFALGTDCSPYLFKLPEEYALSFRRLMIAAGVKQSFEDEDFIAGLRKIKLEFGEKKLNDRPLQVAVDLANQLSESLDISAKDLNQTLSERGEIFLPDSTSVMRPVHDLCMKNCPWIQDDSGVLFVHDKIPWSTCRNLRVKTRREEALQHHAVGISFGQKEKLVNRLRRILTSYPCEKEILKELLQNADDAQATEIYFIKDPRHHPNKRVFEDSWKPLQGPALCVYNNKPFTKADIEGIQNLGEGSKGNDPNKTGQYGVGFNAVYHLTDVPSFKSKSREIGDVLGVFDPHCKYVPGASPQEPGRLFQDTKTLKRKFPDVFPCYLEDHFATENATMFRFPLRNKMMAAKSQVSSSEVTVRTLDVMMEDLKKELFEVLLFVNNVEKISLCSVDEYTGKLVYTYSVEVVISEKDKEKRQQFAAYVGNIAKSLKKSCMFNPCKIPVKKCSYVLNITDNLGDKEKWFVVQQVGFEKPVDESVVRAFTKGDLGMLPRGGVACLLVSTRKEQRRRKAYCFLPLPFETDLPVHVNGHFALDHEARRSLWRDERGGYRSDWNNALLSDVIASCYLTVLDKARNFMGLHVKCDSTPCNIHCSKEVIMHNISAYEKLFPRVSLDEPYWATLVHSVYHEMNEKASRLLPVVRNVAQHPIPRVQLTWLPPTGSGRNKAFFNTLAVTGCLAEERTRFESMSTKALRAKSLEVFESILLKTGFNLVAFSVLVLESLQRSGVNAVGITPSSVIAFYRTFRSQDPHCKICSIPSLVEETAFESASNVCLLLKYCRDDPDFLDKLPGLPLLLTQDNVLRAFEERSPKFLSSYQDILPGSPGLFVHEELRRRIFSNAASLEAPVFETLNAQGLANSLHSTLPRDYHGAKEFVRWFPKETEIPNHRWIYRVWNFLREQAAEILGDPKVTLEVTVQRIRVMLMPLSEWCILPVTKTAYRRLQLDSQISLAARNSKTAEHFLVPLQRAESVLDFSNIANPNLVGILRAVGVPELNSVVLSTPDANTLTLVFTKSDSYHFARHLVATLRNPASLLVSLDHMMKSNPYSLEGMLKPSDCVMILQYFSNNVNSLSVIDKSILKKIPLYPAIHGGTTRVDQHRVCVLPSEVPREEIDKLEQTTHVLFLESFYSLSALYKFLEFEGISPVDVYCTFILKDFEVFSPKARLAHLMYVRDSLLPLVEIQNDVKQDLLRTLSAFEIIPSKDGTLKTASSFYDPRNTVFTTMLPDEAFPSSPLDCSCEWLSFLRKIGLVHEVTCDHFLRFVTEVAREAATQKHEDTRKKSQVLVSHLFTRPNAVREGLFRSVCSIPFLAGNPLKPSLRALCQSHEESKYVQTPYIAFKGSVTEDHAEIVWTEADLLPSWADPRKHSCPREDLAQLQVVTKPTIAVVISHCHNICFRFENSSGNESICPQKCYTLKVVMEQIYTFLEQNALANYEAKKRLGSTPCILVENERKFVRPKQVVLELYEKLQIKPFLYRLPPEFGKYQKLFEYLGCSKSVTAGHYTNVLEMMHDQSKGLKLHPNEITKAFEAMRGLLTTLQEEREIAPAFSCLYLPAMSPGRGSQNCPLPVSLHNSIELLFNDMPRYGSRLQYLDHLFVVDSKTIEVDLESLMNLLPSEVRPQMVSCVVKEKLNEPASGEIVLGGAIDVLKSKISSPQFITGVLRLIRHDNRGRKLLDKNKLANVESKLRRVEFVSMDRIVTTLFHLDVPIAESEHEVSYFIKKILDSDEELWKVYVNRTSIVENSDSEITLAITNVIVEACEGLLKDTAKFIPEMLRINPRDIRSLLDKMDIAHGVTDLGERDIYPDPGDFISIEDHHLLDENFQEFDRGEFVGYELDDPSLQMEDGNATYIYAVVLEEILSEGGLSLLCKKYKILIGEDKEPIEAEAADLYKFHRLQVVASSALVPLGKQGDQPTQRYKMKVFEEISDALLEAWRLPENSRRKIIKRLFLRWHPDKNPGNETFCKAVCQHLQNELERLKVQNREPHAFYETLFDSMGARAKKHQSQREGYRNNFFQHYGSLESSGNRSWRAVPPSFSTKNPQPGESKRWFRQAEKDLAAAENDIATARPSYEWACFKCHQVRSFRVICDCYTEQEHCLKVGYPFPLEKRGSLACVKPRLPSLVVF